MEKIPFYNRIMVMVMFENKDCRTHQTRNVLLGAPQTFQCQLCDGSCVKCVNHHIQMSNIVIQLYYLLLPKPDDNLHRYSS